MDLLLAQTVKRISVQRLLLVSGMWEEMEWENTEHGLVENMFEVVEEVTFAYAGPGDGTARDPFESDPAAPRVASFGIWCSASP